MPGPVSESYNPLSLKNSWSDEHRKSGFRYFVLKSSDVFRYLTEEQLEEFDNLLREIENGRVNDGREPPRAWWVYGRHWPNAEKVKDTIEAILGHRIGEPY